MFLLLLVSLDYSLWFSLMCFVTGPPQTIHTTLPLKSHIKIALLAPESTDNNFNCNYHIGSVMVSLLVLNVVDRELEPWSIQTKEKKIGICCFSARQRALTSKNKDRLAWNIMEQHV